MNHSTPTADLLPQNQAPAKTWSSGGAKYNRISQQIADAIEHCVDRLAPTSEEHVLDVATGTGWTARRIHARGVQVTGVDFGEDVVRAAQQHAQPGQLDFEVGDAEALRFEDGAFDAVISTFGVMFCGDPKRAASELARVCKPGGRLALATWATTGGIADMFQVIKKYLTKLPAHSPFAWGDRDRLHELLGEDFDLKIETGVSYYREPKPSEAWKAFAEGYGPVVTLLGQLSIEDRSRFRTEFEAFHEAHSTELGVLVPRPYVITVGTRKS